MNLKAMLLKSPPTFFKVFAACISFFFLLLLVITVLSLAKFEQVTEGFRRLYIGTSFYVLEDSISNIIYQDLQLRHKNL